MLTFNDRYLEACRRESAPIMPDRFDYHPPVDVRTEYGPSDEDAVNFIMGEWFF